jgi:hypothetical protein
MNQLSNKDALVAIDIADTLTHYRRDCGCFPTIESLKLQITTELSTRSVDNKSYAMLMVEDVLRHNEEWFDKESVPE